jgi:hypothetical protein
VSSTFDLATHQRDRIRRLEARVGALEFQEQKLVRVLRLALRVATRDGQECSPVALLEVLDTVANGEDDLREQDARLVQLLRDTDPARLRAAA